MRVCLKQQGQCRWKVFVQSCHLGLLSWGCWGCSNFPNEKETYSRMQQSCSSGLLLFCFTYLLLWIFMRLVLTPPSQETHWIVRLMVTCIPAWLLNNLSAQELETLTPRKVRKAVSASKLTPLPENYLSAYLWNQARIPTTSELKANWKEYLPDLNPCCCATW